ncbi:MAG: tyrosine--tRNA ligase [Candidatus Portnoybacteria bacterium]|nr:tyrosine--tRNA ligase [Candidatus Portnoybacteria bacterium]
MNTEEKTKLISRFTEEVMTPDDLEELLSKNVSLNHYIGFEISGKIHLGTGLMCMQKVKDFHDAGVKCHIFLADWHTWINDKLGGDREAIGRVAVGYFKEGMSAAYECLGGNPEDLNFILGSELYHGNDDYWKTMIEVSKHTSLSRMQRSIDILGRKEGQAVDFAKLIYPAMQVADIFAMQIHFPHAGSDQRKAQVIARDVAKKLTIMPLKAGEEIVKPAAVHHHLILGLQKPAIWPIPSEIDKHELWSSMKMSKSKPDSAVFIHDSEDEIKRKVMKAFCPEKEIGFNPIIDWAEYLIFTREKSITIRREEAHGGDLEIKDTEELKELFQKGELHPQDLKKFVAEYLSDLLKPIRDRFSKGKPKEMIEELETVLRG